MGLNMQNTVAIVSSTFSCFYLLLCTSVSFAQTEPYPITQAIKRLVIDEASALFESEHVIPEIGQEYATALRVNMANGTFDDITTGREFMTALDRVLWPIDTDGHVSINFHANDIPTDFSGDFDNISPQQIAEANALARRNNFGIEIVRRLAGNIGYLDYRAFTEAEGSKEAIAAAMDLVRYTDALIIDLRLNGGGSPNMHAEFVSYFLQPINAAIATFVDREGRVTDEYYISEELIGPRYGEDRPVFVLNSRNTYSAAEAFAYTLQVRNRARIVGETTMGGARPVHSHRLHSRFMLRVPVARSFDPLTNSNWEESGVIPDYELPATDALTFAYKTALEELIEQAEFGPEKGELEIALSELIDSQ